MNEANKKVDEKLDENTQRSAGSNQIKDTANWTTGDEPMTASQQSYLGTLSGDEVTDLTKAEAADMIDSYKSKNSNGTDNTETTGNAIKDPNDWTTGEEEMTGAQRSYLKTLADEAGEEVEENLTKAEASIRIEALQHKTGRGTNSGKGRD